MDSQSRRGALWGSKSEGRHEAGTRRIALTAEWAAHRVVGRFSGFQNLIGACRGRSGTVFLVCSSGRGRGVGEPPRHVAGELRCRGQVLKKIVRFAPAQSHNFLRATQPRGRTIRRLNSFSLLRPRGRTLLVLNLLSAKNLIDCSVG